jgi:hypothetical protein
MIVILSEAKDLLFAGGKESRSFASLRMTTLCCEFVIIDKMLREVNK